MSLINDALKRARQAQKKQPPAPSEESPLEPVEAAVSSRRPSMVLVVGAFAILLLGCWFLWQSFTTGQPKQTAAAESTLTNKPPAATKSSLASNLTRPFQAVAKLDAAIKDRSQTNALEDTPPASRPQTVSTAAPVRPAEAIPTNPSPANPTAVPPVAKSSNPPSEPPQIAKTEVAPLTSSRSANFPPLKLQGIYFRLSKPSVLINNRTLFLGDEIEGVRIVGIERFSAKLAMKGVTNDYFLK